MGFMLKQSGAWADASKVYKKISGAWVEQTDFASVIPDNVRYQNGGEYIPPIRTVTVTGSGSANYCYLTINGTKVYKPRVFEVTSGDVIGVYVAAISCGVTLNGETVMSAKGTYEYTVESDCAIALSINYPMTAYVDITTQ